MIIRRYSNPTVPFRQNTNLKHDTSLHGRPRDRREDHRDEELEDGHWKSHETKSEFSRQQVQEQTEHKAQERKVQHRCFHDLSLFKKLID